MVEEELGLKSVIQILPDSWLNVPWTVTNAAETLKTQTIAQRKLIEEVRSYAVDVVERVVSSIVEMIEENEEDKKSIRSSIVNQEAKMTR